MMNTFLITGDQSKALLEFLKAGSIPFDYVRKKNQLVFEKGGSTLAKIRLPISLNSPESYYKSPDDRANYVLIMIRSGVASAGYFEDGENIDHRVFRAYMVRKKQGMSQLKYLKTKGKSRAGSRVRLADTLDFFEKINGRLNEYFESFHVDRIGMSCPVTLIPYFYGSKTPTPFRKEDPRIFKIPKHVQNPTYESLLDVNNYLLKGEISYAAEGKELIDLFLEVMGDIKSQSPDEENW